MARSVSEILRDIEAFAPVDDNWLALDDLLAELWQHEVPPSALPSLFRVFERFPEDDGQGVLWSIVHGVEDRDDYESALRESLARSSSFMGSIMLKRLLKSQNA